MSRSVPIFVAVLAFAALACGTGDNPSLPGPCKSAADCAGLQTAECVRPACVDHSCGFEPDPEQEGASCGLDDLCTIEPGRCAEGRCEGARTAACPAVVCMVGTCVPEKGGCVYQPASDGTDCEADGNPCTSDSCVDGACTPGRNDCPCDSPSDCRRSADLCAGEMSCISHRCVPDAAAAVRCPEGGECESFSCNPETGQCQREVVADGTLCGQTDRCTAASACDSGVCRARPKCDDSNPCTVDVCDPESGECTFQNSEGHCDDKDPCTTDGVCVDGECQTEPVDCDDRNQCTQDGCQADGTCRHLPVETGTPCLLADPCVAMSECSPAAVCVPSKPACDDGNRCTVDTCDPVSGACGFTPASGSCDDDNPCTVDEYCMDGVCGGGREMPGCCNFDADCSDEDACTVSTCELAACSPSVQDESTCLPDPSGCSMSWCAAESGVCGNVKTSFPLTLFSWNLKPGGSAPGFSWGTPAGRIGTDGATVQAGGRSAQIRLPRRLVPAGTIVTWVEIGKGQCSDVSWSVLPGVSGCVDRQGEVVAAAAFDASSVTDDAGRLDLAVNIAAGSAVAGIRAFAWHVKGCSESGLTVAESQAPTDIAMDAGPDGVFLVFRDGGDIRTAAVTTGGRLTGGSFDQNPFAIVPGRFGISMARGADGSRMAAWGAADDRIRLGAVGSTGEPGPVHEIPANDSESTVHAWPSLAAASDGSLIAFASGPATDFDIVAGRLSHSDFEVEDVTRLNDSTAGTRTRPSIVRTEDGYIAAWVSEIVSPTKQYAIVLRAVDALGYPQGLEVLPHAQATPIESFSVVSTSSLAFCAWQKADGSIAGAILDRQSLAVTKSFTAFAGSRASLPKLLPYGSDSVVLTVIDGTGSTAGIKAAKVSGDGTVSDQFTVVSPVLASSSFAVSRMGPFMYVLAYSDMLSSTPGVVIVPFAPQCQEGFAAPSGVCTGFGPDGRFSGGAD